VSSGRACATSIGRRRRHDHEVADADRLRLLVAEQDNVGDPFGRDEIRISGQAAILIERDAHSDMDVRPHESRRDIDDAHVVFRLRLLKRLGQRADRGFRGVVRLAGGAGLAIRDRAHVDDRTALARAHAGQHRPDAVDHALEQHIDIVIEVVDWPASEVADMEKPSIVDEAIGRAESGFGLFHRRLEASKVGNVPFDEAMRRIAQPIDRRRMTRDQEKRMTLARKSLG
jgi:hypothetical protein